MDQFQINRTALIDYIESQGWKYTVTTDEDGYYVARMGFNTHNRLRGVTTFAVAEATCIQSMAVSPINADPEDYDAVIEFITRANYGLKLGNFEFDHRDGEVRFQTCLISLSGVPDHANVEAIVDMPHIMMSRYGDGLAKALLGFGDPEADVAVAEGAA
jgi:hypothetical protein